jgi:hypothetical protein
MYSNKDKARLKTIEDIVHGNSKKQTSPSVQARVKELFMTVFGHTRSSRTLKLARTRKKYCVRNRKKCRKNKKRIRHKERRKHKKLATRALYADLLFLHTTFDDRLQALEAAMADQKDYYEKALAEQKDHYEKIVKGLENRLADQETRYKNEMADREKRYKDIIEGLQNELANMKLGKVQELVPVARQQVAIEHQRALEEQRAVHQRAMDRLRRAHRQDLANLRAESTNKSVHIGNLSCAAQARTFMWWH